MGSNPTRKLPVRPSTNCSVSCPLLVLSSQSRRDHGIQPTTPRLNAKGPAPLQNWTSANHSVWAKRSKQDSVPLAAAANDWAAERNRSTASSWRRRRFWRIRPWRLNESIVALPKSNMAAADCVSDTTKSSSDRDQKTLSKRRHSATTCLSIPLFWTLNH